MKFSASLMVLSSKSIATATMRGEQDCIAYLLDARWLSSRARPENLCFSDEIESTIGRSSVSSDGYDAGTNHDVEARGKIEIAGARYRVLDRRSRWSCLRQAPKRTRSRPAADATPQLRDADAAISAASAFQTPTSIVACAGLPNRNHRKARPQQRDRGMQLQAQIGQRSPAKAWRKLRLEAALRLLRDRRACARLRARQYRRHIPPRHPARSCAGIAGRPSP